MQLHVRLSKSRESRRVHLHLDEYTCTWTSTPAPGRGVYAASSWLYLHSLIVRYAFVIGRHPRWTGYACTRRALGYACTRGGLGTPAPDVRSGTPAPEVDWVRLHLVVNQFVDMVASIAATHFEHVANAQ